MHVGFPSIGVPLESREYRRFFSRSQCLFCVTSLPPVFGTIPVSSVKPATTISELRQAVSEARDDAFLVEPRVVRRIIRELHGFARLSTSIPHTDVLVADAEDIRILAHPDELGLSSFEQLPDCGILVAQPEEYELESLPPDELRQMIWARLFHGCIDLTMRQHVVNGTLSRLAVQELIDRIGQVEFDEVHAVLRSELRIISTSSRVEAWCEFVAVYLQLQRFSPDLLPVWFPSLEHTSAVSELVTQHVDHEKLFNQTRPANAELPDPTPAVMKDEKRLAWERRGWAEGAAQKPSTRKYTKYLRKRIRWEESGNIVAAAVCAMRAAEMAVSEEDQRSARDIAREDINRLADRLQAALSFRESDLDDWKQSLWELLKNSTQGFWNSDKRLLYDLQKVCLDHERTVYQVDLVKWIVSRGKRPLRRPLENLREVMMAKHLASSASRLVYVRLSGAERERLSHLIHSAAEIAEEQMRERMRSAVQETIREVGLKPGSVPEQVAFDKMVEESLDCIVERGYLTMGYLRDAISRNDLKLPDLSGPSDLIRGDHLLRTDDRLDETLDGVYRRGEFYLRWLQIVSSLFFGWRTGRFATLFIAIPFGSAIMIVVGSHHLIGVLTDSIEKPKSALHANADSDSENDEPDASAEDDTVPESEDLETEGNPTAATASGETISLSDGTADPESTVDSEQNSESGSAVTETDASIASESPPVRVDVTDSSGSGSQKPANDSIAAASGAEEEIQDDGEASAEEAVIVNDGGSATAKPVAESGDGPSDQADNEATVEQVSETVAKEPHPLYTWIGDQTLPLTASIGFLMIALIHLPRFRNVCWNLVRYVWKIVRTVIYDIPSRVLKLRLVRQFWRSRWFTRIRRSVINPLLVAWIGCRILPLVIFADPRSWQMVIIIGVLLSLAVNSRLGRDAEELAEEWLANAWHDLRSRFFMAVFEWVMDFFKWLLNVIERFIYAVDEWLRFHSGETFPTLVAKAVLGFIWSLLSFLIRIYVNLLIEPTLHPLKHFPVVTVAHKIFLPFILIIQDAMLGVLTPYFGLALAGAITWFNILFLPGIFGFLVWELKENWRLYATNRVPHLMPVIIGSHGEGGARLLKPGFYSGTLPKLFGRLRRLERKEPSFHRFSERRAHRELLEHAERDIRRFVERDLLQLLSYCSVWDQLNLKCKRVHAASNSFLVEVSCEELGSERLCILFQEQSGWLVATVSEFGFLNHVTPEQLHSFETALRGFYAKAQVDLVREQMERQLVGQHPYDIAVDGLLIWPERQFDRQITCDLHRRHQIRPWPQGLAASYGLQPVSRDLIVFAESKVLWEEWKQVWEPPADSELPEQLQLACFQSARASLLRPSR